MNKKRVFVYIRVSTKKQADEGYSIPEQIERLKKYAESMDWMIVRMYIDDGYSGSNMDRPQLKAMLKDIEQNKCDLVLVDKIDRLARNLLDTVTMIDQIFKSHNVSFVSRAEAFDTSTPVGKGSMVMMAMFAEMERERINERMMDGKRGRRKEGLWAGGAYTPVGYVYDKESGTLIIDEVKAAHVRKVFELYNNGMPMRKIEEYMHNHGYDSGRGKFSAKSIKTILGNKTYCGYLRDGDDWVDGKHEPIISIDVFEKAQEHIQRLKDNKEPNSRGAYYYTTYFGNFIYCAHCGAKYIRTYGGGVNSVDGKRRKYYTCASKIKRSPFLIKDPNCKNKNWNVDKFDNAIFDAIRELHLDPSKIDNLVTDQDDSIPERIDLIMKQIDALSRQQSRLLDLYTLESIDMDVLKSKNESINYQKEQLTNELSELENSASVRLNKADSISLIDTLVDMLDNGADMQEIRSMLALIIDKIVVDGNNVSIHWKFL